MCVGGGEGGVVCVGGEVEREEGRRVRFVCRLKKRISLSVAMETWLTDSRSCPLPYQIFLKDQLKRSISCTAFVACSIKCHFPKYDDYVCDYATGVEILHGRPFQ